MSSVSITFAHVLDGIAMSIKTSTSLKKALSYRGVEILLVDLHGYQKVNQESLFDSGTVRTDRHQVPEVIHEVFLRKTEVQLLAKNTNIFYLVQLVQTVNKLLKSCVKFFRNRNPSLLTYEAQILNLRQLVQVKKLLKS